MIDRLIPPHPAHKLSCGRGVEALVLAILDGHHALYKVGETAGSAGDVGAAAAGPATCAALSDYRLGHILEALFAANLNKVYSAVALNALEVMPLPHHGCIRTRPPLPCMEPTQTNRRPQEPPGRPMAIAKTVVMISNRCSSVSGSAAMEVSRAPRGRGRQPQ